MTIFRSLVRSVIVVGVVAAGTSACAGSGAAGGTVSPAAEPMPPSRRANIVTAETIANAGDEPIEKIIADRVPGVRLDRASDGSLMLRIRGTTSWTTDNRPLCVVDGVPLTSGSLVGINTADIERIEVLKDAASTAMYGSRGASGVVLIATKKP